MDSFEFHPSHFVGIAISKTDCIVCIADFDALTRPWGSASYIRVFVATVFSYTNKRGTAASTTGVFQHMHMRHSRVILSTKGPCTTTSIGREARGVLHASKGHVEHLAQNQRGNIVLAKSGHDNARQQDRLTIAVDVDEVLGRFVHSLNAFCHETYSCQYHVSDYFVYDFARVWQCSQDESNHRVHEFFDSVHFRDGIEVIPGSYESLMRLKESIAHIRLNVVTSRQHVIQDHTMEWLENHFPDTFDAVYFGNHFALEGASKKKSEICAEIGAGVLIDDNPVYAMECAQAGIKVLLYDWNLEYPWSKTKEGPVHDNIIRVSSWSEVEERIYDMSSSMSLFDVASHLTS